MNLQTDKWVLLFLLLSPVSGVLGADSPISDDYYEEYEDESPQNTTSYKLNVPDSFKSYLEDLLTKANTTSGEDEKEKVTSSKHHVEKKDEIGRLKNRQGFNYNPYSKRENQIDVDKTLKSVANALLTSETLNNPRKKIFHPYASTNISQLLSSLEKDSSDSNVRNQNLQSSLTKKIDKIHNNRLKSPEIISKQSNKDSNDAIDRGSFFRKEELSSYGKLAETPLETQHTLYTPSTKILNKQILPSKEYDRSVLKRVPTNAFIKPFDKENLQVVPFNRTNNKSSSTEPETLRTFKSGLPAELLPTSNNRKRVVYKKLRKKTKNETPLSNAKIHKIGNILQSPISRMTDPENVNTTKSYKSITDGNSVNSKSEHKGFQYSPSYLPKVVINDGFISGNQGHNNLPIPVTNESSTTYFSEPRSFPKILKPSKQILMMDKPQSNHFIQKNQDDSNLADTQPSLPSAKLQTDPTSINSEAANTNTNVLGTNNSNGTDNSLKHIHEDTSDNNQVTNKASVASKPKAFPTTITKDALVNNRYSKSKTTFPSTEVDKYLVEETSSTSPLRIDQGFNGNILKNKIKNAFVANKSTKKKRKKNIAQKHQDKITSRGIMNIYPVKTPSKQVIESDLSHSALSQEKFSNLPSEKTHFSNIATPISLTNRLEPVKNTSNSTHILPIANNATTLKQYELDSSSATSITKNVTKSHPIEELLGGFVMTTANKNSSRKRKRKNKQPNVNKTSAFHALKEPLDKQNNQESTKDQLNKQFISSDRKKTLSSMKLSDTKYLPKVHFLHTGSIVDSGNGNDEQAFANLHDIKEQQTLLTDINIGNHNINNDKRGNKFGTITITQKNEESNGKVIKHDKDNIALQNEKENQLLSSSGSKQNLQNGEVYLKQIKDISDSTNVLSDKKYVNLPVTNSVLGVEENNLKNHNSKSNKTDKPNSVPFSIESFATKVMKENRQLFGNKYSDEGSKTWNSHPSLAAEEVQSHRTSNNIKPDVRETKANEHLSNKGVGNKQLNTLSKAGLRDKTLEKVYRFNSTSLLSDDKARNETEKHPIEELIESLVTIPPTKSTKRRKKKRTGQKQNLLDEQLDSDNQLTGAPTRFNESETNIISMTQSKKINRTQNDEAPITPKLNSLMITKQQRQEGTASGSSYYTQKNKANLADNEGNSSLDLINDSKLKDKNAVSNSTVDGQLKQQLLSSKIYLQKSPANFESIESNVVNSKQQRNHIHLLVPNITTKSSELNSSMTNKQTNQQSASSESSHHLQNNTSNLTSLGGNNSFPVGKNTDHPVTNVKSNPTDLNTPRIVSVQPKQNNMSSFESKSILKNSKVNLGTNQNNDSFVSNISSKPTDFNISKPVDVLHSGQNRSTSETKKFLQNSKANFGTTESNNLTHDVNTKEHQNLIKSPLTNVPPKSTGLNTSSINDIHNKMHNMSTFESNDYSQKRKVNLESRKYDNSSHIDNMKDQRHPIQIPVTNITSNPTQLNTSILNVDQLKKHNISSLESKHYLEKNKANLETTKSNISHVGNISKHQIPIQLPVTDNPLNSTVLTALRISDVQLIPLNTSSSRSHVGNSAVSVTVNGQNTSNQLIVPNFIPHNNETNAGLSNASTTIEVTAHKLHTPITGYNTNVTQGVNTPNTSAKPLNPYSLTTPEVKIVKHKNFTVSLTKDLATAKENNDKNFYLKHDAKDHSSYTDSNKNESKGQAVSGTRLSNIVNERNIESSVSRDGKEKINEQVPEAHTSTIINKTLWVNTGQKDRSQHQASQTQLVGKNENQTYHGQHATLSKGDINSQPVNSSRSMNLIYFKTKGFDQSPATVNKSDANNIQQTVQDPHGNVLEVLLYKIYNVLMLYLQKTSETNIIHSTSKHQQTNPTSKNEIQETLLQPRLQVTKGNFSSQEKQITQNNYAVEKDKKLFDVNSVVTFVKPDLQTTSTPDILNLGTPSNENGSEKTKKNKSSSVSTLRYSTTQSPNITYVVSEKETDLNVRDKGVNKTGTNPHHAVISETTSLTESTTISHNEFVGKEIKNSSTVIQLKPDLNETLVGLNSEVKSRPTQNATNSLKYEALDVNSTQILKPTKLENGLEVEDVRKLVHKLNYILNSFDYARTFKVEDNKVNNASEHVSQNPSQSSSNNALSSINHIISANTNEKNNQFGRNNENSTNMNISNPIKNPIDQQNLPNTASSIHENRFNENTTTNNSKQAHKGNLEIRSGSFTNDNSIWKSGYLNGEAQIKQVNNNENENPSARKVNLKLRELNENPVKILVENKTSPILIVGNNSSYEKENVNTSAKKIYPNNVRRSLAVNNEVVESKPETIIQNNKNDYSQSSILEEMIQNNFSINKKVAQDLYESGRLHIIITPLDKKPNISVEINDENINNSTRKNPWIFQTKKCEENKNNAIDSSNLTSSSVSVNQVRSTGLRNLFNKFKNNNYRALPFDPHVAYKQDNINKPKNEEVDNQLTRTKQKVSQYGTANGKFKGDNGITKDFSFDVTDINKVTNRKRVTKKEEVVEVNEKVKENKVLGKSKTVQTIKTEVSSVDYV